jgi:uncharacterized protein YcbX
VEVSGEVHGGEQLQEVEVTERGVLGDRAYALIDKGTGKVVSAKSVRLFPNLLDCKAAFVEPPRRGGDLPPVQILLPDSTTVRSDSGEVDRVLSVYFKRNVTLGQAAPDDFTIDQYHPAQTPGATETRSSHRSLEQLSLPSLEWSPRFLSVLSSMCFPSRS